MRYIELMLIFSLFVSCKNTVNDKKLNTTDESLKTYIGKQTITRETIPSVDDLDSPTVTKPLHRFDTSLSNNGHLFHITTQELNEELSLLTATCESNTEIIDTIYESAVGIFEYPDFDSNGYTDILFAYIGINPTYFLYLFNNVTNKFIKIQNYSEFPYSRKLSVNPKYYYSYQRAGCADMNWVSDLFTISDLKIIHLGHIYGQGCDANTLEEPQVIDIFRIPDNDEDRKILIEKLPYLENIPTFGDKWDFIDKYWNKNYTKFN
jgi:hypothetical protein